VDKSGKKIIYAPAQPTPVIMNIKSLDGKARAQYKLTTTNLDSTAKTWTLLGSTLGRQKMP
jgi:hypothetical protein